MVVVRKCPFFFWTWSRWWRVVGVARLNSEFGSGNKGGMPGMGVDLHSPRTGMILWKDGSEIAVITITPGFSPIGNVILFLRFIGKKIPEIRSIKSFPFLFGGYDSSHSKKERKLTNYKNWIQIFKMEEWLFFSLNQVILRVNVKKESYIKREFCLVEVTISWYKVVSYVNIWYYHHGLPHSQHTICI